MEELIGKPEDTGMQILLAHNPKYGKPYFEWGADLIMSGHYHGALSASVNITVFHLLNICFFRRFAAETSTKVISI